MPINFDPNSLNNTFDKNFGAGAYNAGLSNASNAARLKQQASLAKTDYLKRLTAAKTAALKPKKTFSDALDYWNDPTNKQALLDKGAYRMAKDLQNDPLAQEGLKSQGYNINDLVNAAYNAASNGQYKSKGAYNDYASQLAKDTKASNKVADAKSKADPTHMGMGVQDYYDYQQNLKKQQVSQPKQTSFLDKAKHLGGEALDILGRPGNAVRTGIYDALQGQNFLQGAKEGLLGQQHVSGTQLNQKLGIDVNKNPVSKNVSNVLATLLQNTNPIGQAMYNFSSADSKKNIGQNSLGGATEAVLDPLNLIGTGAIGKVGKLFKGGEEAAQGTRELLGLPEPQLRLNAPQLQLEGPKPLAPSLDALNQAGKMPGELKNPIPSMPYAMKQQQFADSLVGFGQQGKNIPKARVQVPKINVSSGDKALLGNKANAILDNISKLQNSPTGSFERRLLQTQNDMKGIHDVGKVNEYKKEFKDAVQKQYEYMKSSMGKGVDSGTTGNGLPGNFKTVNGKFSVSRNPQWYQDFYRANGRKPNNSELMQLAEQQVKNGFIDEVGKIPAYEPKQVQGINSQLDEISTILDQHPDQEHILAPIVQALEEDRQRILTDYNHAINGQSPSIDNLYQQVQKPGDPSTFDELIKMNQLESNFNKNNPIQGPREGNLKDALNSDPRIKELAKQLHFKAPEQKISRPASLEEMINNLKSMAPKNPSPQNFPLQFAREKGFNPNLKPNILNRGNADAPNLEGLKNIKPGKSQGYTNIGSAPKTLSPDALDNHGYGLIDTQAKPNPFDVPYKSGDPLPDTSGHIGTKTGKLPLNVKSAVDKGYIKTVDNLHRLSQFDKQVENVLGKGLSASEKTHTLGLNSRGSDMISKQILTSNMVNKNGEAVGNSLKDITMQVPKGKLKQFEDYLVNKHAITRMERGEKVFPDQMQMTIGKSMRIVKNYEKTNPEFKNLANQYYDYNKQLGQHWLVDTGILSKKDWEGYLQANPHYVPNNRIFSDMERPLFYGTKKGFANQSNPVKKAIGSQRQIVSPIESTIEHTAQYVKTAKRNEVMQTLINNIKQDPKAFKDWAEIVPTDKTPASVMETLQKEGVDGVLGELNKGFDQKPDLTKGNIVTGIIDGQKVHVKVNDPYLLDAITNLQPKAQNLVIHSLGQVTRVMKNLTTGINPVFSLTRNVFRDIPTAFTNSKSTNNPLVFSKDLVQSFVSVMKNDNLYKSFKAIGGGHSSPISSSVNLLAQSKNSILPQKGLKPLLSKGLGKLENLNNAIEAAPRLAEYKRIAGNTYDSKMNALYEANDVTVNFNKYGNVSKEIDSVIPYFNAAVQGLDKTGRAFLNPKTAPVALTKAFAAITVPSMLAYAVNYNDPNYQKVSNYIKDTNILIPKGDGTFFKIPVPRELGTVFHAGVNRVMRAWVEQDPKAFDGFAQDLVSNFALPTRSILAPFNDIRANKNYIGAPIVPQDLQGLSPKYQYDAQTSEPAKAIGNLINVSPKQIDYLTKSYGGVLGELGIPATTKNTTIGQTLKQKVTVDPAYSNDIMSNFYNQKSKLDQANADFTKQGIQSSNMNEGLRKAMNTQATLISKLRKQTKTVQNDSTLTPAQRLARLRQLQETMNQIASQNAR